MAVSTNADFYKIASMLVGIALKHHAFIMAFESYISTRPDFDAEQFHKALADAGLAPGDRKKSLEDGLQVLLAAFQGPIQ